MKKQLGILRNRHDKLTSFKKQAVRKKNRFQMVGKDDLDDVNTYTLTTTHSDPASISELSEDGDQSALRAVKLFQQVRGKMLKVDQLQKKMAELTKARLTSLRQKQNEKYDESIMKLASQATQTIVAAEGTMRQIPNISSASQTSKKILTSMQSALAGQLQQRSRKLRNQEQQYFRRIKSYQGTVNSAIQLTTEQRQVMKGDWDILDEEEKEQDQHEGRIGQLVGNISKLSTLYKQLNNLVVTQGTVIDRIDYNLEQTQQHTSKAVVHLKGADEHASSAFADKVIKFLAITIIMMAVILGVKYMK